MSLTKNRYHTKFSQNLIKRERERKRKNHIQPVQQTKMNLIKKIIVLFALMISSAHARGRGGYHYNRGRGCRADGQIVPRTHLFPSQSSGIDLLSDIFSVPIYMNSLLRQSEAQFDRMERSTPRYHISETETGTELTMEVPGVSAKDLSIEIQDDNLLRISGARRYQEHGSDHEYKFEQTFSLDNVNADDIKVTLVSGILRISAPRKEKVMARKIAIEEAVPEAIAIGTKATNKGESTDEKDTKVSEATIEVDGLSISEDEDAFDA